MKKLVVGQKIKFALANPEGPNKGTGVVMWIYKHIKYVKVKITSLERGTAERSILVHHDEII